MAIFSPHLPRVFADKEMPFGVSTDHLLFIVSAIFTAAERKSVCLVVGVFLSYAIMQETLKELSKYLSLLREISKSTGLNST
jgi:hypothetical protein